MTEDNARALIGDWVCGDMDDLIGRLMDKTELRPNVVVLDAFMKVLAALAKTATGTPSAPSQAPAGPTPEQRQSKIHRAQEATRDRHLMIRLDTDTWGCRYCDARWDDRHYYKQNASAAWPCKGAPVEPPEMIWVLMRGDNPLRWYATEARAQQDLALVDGTGSADWHYTVHAVPRVE